MGGLLHPPSVSAPPNLLFQQQVGLSVYICSEQRKAEARVHAHRPRHPQWAVQAIATADHGLGVSGSHRVPDTVSPLRPPRPPRQIPILTSPRR